MKILRSEGRVLKAGNNLVVESFCVCGVSGRTEQTEVRFSVRLSGTNPPSSPHPPRLNISSYPHLIYSPPFLSIFSKTCSEMSATHLRFTAAGYKTALKKRVTYLR